MNKNRELVKNTFIIFIGRFCTQLVSFILIPMYTFYLVTSDYGYVDLINTYVSLLAPIIILRFDTAIFRFLIDYRNNENEKKQIISSSIILMLFQILVLIIIFEIVRIFIDLNYRLAILLNIIFVSASSFLLQLTRGIGKNIDYSIASIISAVITVTLNVVMIVVFKYNASSILYASVLANAFCSIYLIFKNKIHKYIDLKSFDKKRLMNMLKYSLPMIPDGLSWWIVNVSDRTIISIIINTSANGIYAVSSKFSNILSSVFQIFNMSWQESASMHINDKDRDAFFSQVLNNTYVIFYSLCIMILVSMPFIFYFFIGEEYQSAYFYIPILLMGNLFNALANIFGGVYIAKKETNSVAKTTLLAAAVNIAINIIMIRKYGLYAAAISTLLSYIVVAIYRYFDVKRYVDMRLKKRVLLFTLISFVISSSIYYKNSFALNVINFIMVGICIVIINKAYLKLIIQKIKSILLKRGDY